MRMIAHRNPEGKLHLPIAQFRTPKRGTLALELVLAPSEDTEPVMRSYTKGLGYSEVWYFTPSSALSMLEEMREKLRESGVDVRSIYTYSADAILFPPLLPKRNKQNKR